MENEGLNNMHDDLIATFTEITSSSKEAAQFFLESHNFDLDSAVSTFLETTTNPNSSAVTTAAGAEVNRSPSLSPSPASSPSRSRSPSPTPPPRPQPTNPKPSSSRDGRIHTFSDLNRSSGNHHGDPDAPQEYYTGGEKSGMLVQGPPKANEADAFLDQIRQAGAVEGPRDHLQQSSSSRTFGGTARLLSGETVSPSVPLHPEVVTHTITFWHNGFTVNDGPLRRFDDPENASFIESIKRSECPEELEPADKRTKVHVQLMRKHEDCPAPQNHTLSFQGAGRTLGSSRSTPPMDSTVAAIDLNSSPQPFRGLVVDQALPTTSIQLRLADGTRMVSRFNHYHTVRDIRGFIDASRVGGLRTYQLQTVGFPPELLTDLDQTIEQAGLANSVVIQKL